MPSQSIILTALPNGFSTEGDLRLSVLISPRLDPQLAPKKLSSFADFAAWPTTISDARFTVKLGTKTVVLTSADFDRTLGMPDLETWSALFPATTFVRPFSMRDHSADAVVSYDTAGMNAIVAKVYAKLTESAGADLPTISELLADANIARLVESVKAIDQQFWDSDNRGPDIAGMLRSYRNENWKGLDRLTAELAAFQLFHTPPSKPSKQEVTRTDDPRIKASWQTHDKVKLDAARAVAELDFHQIVAAMNQYPTLLRRLGLVLDFTIARGAFNAGADLPLTVTADIPRPRIDPSATKLRVTHRTASPATRTRLATTAFIAKSRPASPAKDIQIANGLLKIDDKNFALLQADVDGAGHKLMNFMRSLGAHRRPPQQIDPVMKLPRRIGAPALRNAGLMLVQKRRAELLTGTFVRNKTLDETIKQMFTLPAAAAASVPSLYAEDLIRGYRVDIWDQSKSEWKSLCQRTANYEIAKGTVTLTGLQEEGTVRLGATSSADGYNPDVLYLHETVTVWNGWSLVAQQPGLAVTLQPDLANTPEETVRSSEADVPEGVQLRTSFTATPGSLPRLRYGRVYGVRARVVDLAGNSLAPSAQSYAGDEKGIAAATPYYRFEPIQPPTIALVTTGAKLEPNLPLDGESMMRVAVRTFNDRFDDPAGSTQVALRWAVAPRVPQREAELHGVLDGVQWGSAEQHALLVARDADMKHIEVSMAAAKLGDDPTTITYAALRTGATQVPYLPDPLCTHIVPRLRNYPYPSPPTQIDIPLYPSGSTWPNAMPFYIQVYEQAGDLPRWDADKRTLFIPVPKATRATLRLSAKLSPEALDMMGVWNWIPAARRTAALERAAKNGALWTLTPWRELDIVHPVQRPLLAPNINKVAVERMEASTFVTPAVDADTHCMSTDRVDLHATWHDPHDSPNSVAPRDESKSDLPFSIKITDPQGYAGLVEHLLPDPTNPNRIVFGPNSLSKEKQAMLINKVHDFGDTRYRRVEYHLVATTRFREYMPKGELGKKGIVTSLRTEAATSVVGATMATWALSSAPPPAPEVLYVVPTFGWTRETDANGKQTSKRSGNGLRVWLDRPWNTSGYGEMLAVILPQTNSTIDPNDAPYKNTVTQWGNDAIWKAPFVPGTSPNVNGFPRARTAPDLSGAWLPPGALDSEKLQPFTNFTTRSLPHPGLPLNGSSSGRVDVAPHDVYWDAERRLWYCDIEFPANTAYFPFVRMALARYQPGSIANCHLSNVVLTDFASLAPNRTLTVTRTSATRRQVQVHGFSHEESSGFHEAEQYRTAHSSATGIPSGISQKNVIRVWIEKLTKSQGEDFGWHVVEGNGGWGVADDTSSDYGAVIANPENPIAARVRVDAKAEAVRRPVLDSRSDAELRSAGESKLAQQSKSATTAKFSRSAKMVEVKSGISTKKTFAGDDILRFPDDGPVAEWTALWSGPVELPSVPSGTNRFRLVVAEYEEYLADDATPYGERTDKKAQRLVFVEHVELT